jgi:hypothetical protein
MMSWACRTHEREKVAYRVLVANPARKDYWENLEAEWRIILNL